MAKIKCKGTKLQQELATILTDVAQVISLEHSGAESETYDSTTLDTVGAFKEYDPTGYSEGGSVDGELFYDPALAGHMSLTDLLTTPAAQNWAVVFADALATDMPFAGAGFSFGYAVDMGDGLKGSFSIKVDGDPGFPT
jgi:hypothetical protein